MVIYMERRIASLIHWKKINATLMVLLAYPRLSYEYGVARTFANFERADLVDVTDFYELAVNYVYIDKSLLIEELLTDTVEVPLIIRPNGWGKTTNLNMLKRFFDIEVDGDGQRLPKSKCVNHKLFAGGNINRTTVNGTVESRHLKALAISQHKEYMKRLGKYPVVYVSFRNVSGCTSYRQLVSKMKLLIGDLFAGRSYLRDRLDEFDKADFDNHRNGSIGASDLEESLLFLCRIVSEYFERNVYLFLDDYDTPITDLFVQLVTREFDGRRGNLRTSEEEIFRRVTRMEDFENTVTLLRNILKTSFKHNGALEYGLISGVYDVHLTSSSDKRETVTDVDGDEEEPISKTYTILDDKYFGFYGFVEKEVSYVIKKLSYDTDPNELKQWYGYDICRTVLYNPSSIRHFIANKGQYRHYWKSAGFRGNRDNNVTLADIVLTTDGIQQTLQSLVVAKRFRNYCSSKIHLDGRLVRDLNVLLYGGYLSGNDFSGGEVQDDLRVPNIDIRNRLLREISIWMCGKSNSTLSIFDDLVDQLTKFQTSDFERTFKRLLEAVRIVNNSESINVYYNALLITLIDRLERKYSIEPNSRFDYSRGDVMILMKSIGGTRLIVVKYRTIGNTGDLLEREVNAGLKIIKNLLVIDKYEYAKIRKVLIVILMTKGNRYRLRQEIIINDRHEDRNDE